MGQCSRKLRRDCSSGTCCAVSPPFLQASTHVLTNHGISPIYRYNAFLSGETRITIPGSTQQVTIRGGKYGLLLATDTATVSTTGHVSSTGRNEVTGLMIPTQDGVLPSHNVLHDGPCTRGELDY